MKSAVCCSDSEICRPNSQLLTPNSQPRTLSWRAPLPLHCLQDKCSSSPTICTSALLRRPPSKGGAKAWKGGKGGARELQYCNLPNPRHRSAKKLRRDTSPAIASGREHLHSATRQNPGLE